MSICVCGRERVKIVQFIRLCFPNHLDHSDDSLKINNYRLFHMFTQVSKRFRGFRGAGWWREPGEIRSGCFDRFLSSSRNKRKADACHFGKSFFCVNETIIMTNAHIHSSATRHSLNNFRLPDKIWKPKPMLQCLCSKCSSWSVFLLHYNLQSTRGRRWAVTRQQHKGVEQKKVAG